MHAEADSLTGVLVRLAQYAGPGNNFNLPVDLRAVPYRDYEDELEEADLWRNKHPRYVPPTYRDLGGESDNRGDWPKGLMPVNAADLGGNIAPDLTVYYDPERRLFLMVDKELSVEEMSLAYPNAEKLAKEMDAEHANPKNKTNIFNQQGPDPVPGPAYVDPGNVASSPSMAMGNLDDFTWENTYEANQLSGNAHLNAIPRR